MKRRLILVCSLAVVGAFAAWMAYAYVEGATPFAKAPKADETIVLAAAGPCHEGAQACGGAQACQSAQACQAGQTCRGAEAGCAPGACTHKCSPAGCQKCPSMQGGKCAAGQGQACASGGVWAAGASCSPGKCQHAGNCVCPKGPGAERMAPAAACAGAAPAGCQAAKAAGMCSAKSACGSTCPLTK